jgi:hypothetical protein
MAITSRSSYLIRYKKNNEQQILTLENIEKPTKGIR